MATSSLPLTSLSEAQRAQAQERFLIIRPALDKEITQAEIVHTHQISARTIQRWIKNYREKGLAGLADAKTRSDKGKSRRLPVEGHVNRLKLIERSMYGRAEVDLLKLRVLHHSKKRRDTERTRRSN